MISEDQRANIRAEILDALISAGDKMTPRQISEKAISAERTDDVAAVLRELMRNGEIEASTQGNVRYYELALVADDEIDTPPVVGDDDADTATFALWSNGALTIRSAAGGIELSRSEAIALIVYLDGTRLGACCSYSTSAGGTA